MYAPRRARCRGGVNADHGLETGGIINQGEHVSTPDKKRCAIGQPRRELLRDERPDSIIAAVRIADASHKNFAIRVQLRHDRWIVSLRKCVEHEMQGS